MIKITPRFFVLPIIALIVIASLARPDFSNGERFVMAPGQVLVR